MSKALTVSINGGVKFHMSVEISPAELSTWSQDRIARFFEGIAQVLRVRVAADRIDHVQAEQERLTEEINELERLVKTEPTERERTA